jgi:hypothetical protein
MNRRGRFFLFFSLPLTLAVVEPLLAQPQVAAPGTALSLPTATPTRTPTRTPTPRSKTDRPAQGTGPGAASQASGAKPALPTATQTPLPVPKKPPSGAAAASSSVVAGSSMASILNTPYHALDRLDFDAVWDGQSFLKTFSFTTNAKGYIRAEIPPGPFHVTEIRELGPPKTAGSKNPGQGFGQQPMITQETKGKVSFTENQPGPWTYGADAGNQILIHVVFKPKFDISSMMAGQKSATMKVSGPGPKGNWALSIPLQGMFNGLQLKPVFLADEREPYVIEGDGTRDLLVGLTGVGTAVNGTIRGGTLLPGVSVAPVPAAAPANGTTKVNVRLGLKWGAGGLQPDAQPRSIELIFDYPGGPQRLTLSLTPVPGFLQINSLKRSDCGVAEFNFQLNADARAQGYLMMWGNNWDLINRRYVWGEARVEGQRFAGDVSIFYERKGDQVLTYARFGATPPEVMARIKRGAVTFACQLVKVLGPPENQPK